MLAPSGGSGHGQGMKTWEQITSLAARQHGVVARWQLVETGLTNGQVGAAVRHGRLGRLARGVYLVEGAMETPLVAVMAGVLRAGPGARAAGERLLAAAGVRDAAEDGGFAILVPPGRRITGLEVPVRADGFESAGVTASVRGIPSWGVPRNLLEAAVDTSDDEHVARLADGVRRTSRARMASVRRMATDHPGHEGGRRLLLLGCLDLDAAESPMERVLEVVLADLQPQRQVRLAPDIRVDFLIPSLRVVVEYDGSDHESGRARSADADRDRRIRDLGYGVVHVTRRDLRDPAALLARIVRAAATAAG